MKLRAACDEGSVDDFLGCLECGVVLVVRLSVEAVLAGFFRVSHGDDVDAASAHFFVNSFS